MERTVRRMAARGLALLLALCLLTACFGTALAEDGDEEPNPVKKQYTISGIDYYKVDKLTPGYFEDYPDKFLCEMFANKIVDKDWSMADLWTEVAVSALFSNDSLTEYCPNQAARKFYTDPLHSVYPSSGQHRNTAYPEDHPDRETFAISTDVIYATSLEKAADKIQKELAKNHLGREATPSEIEELYANNDIPGMAKLLYNISDSMKTKEQDVVAVAVHMRGKTKDKPSDRFDEYVGVVLYFTNFQAIALLPDAEEERNYVHKTIKEETIEDAEEYASNVKNLTNVAATATQTVTNSWSSTVTSTVSGSNSYSFSAAVKVGAEVDFMFGKLSTELAFTETEAFTQGWQESKAKTASNSVSDSISVILPPFTNVILEQGSSRTEVETRYNCPVGLKYAVTTESFHWIHVPGTTESGASGSDTSQDGASQGDDSEKSNPNETYCEGRYCWSFGPDARTDLYKRALQNGHLDIETDTEQGSAIKWGRAMSATKLSKKYIEQAAQCIPVSPTGASFMETMTTHSTNVKSIVPTEPLAAVKLVPPANVSFISGEEFSYGNLNYLHADMTVGESSFTNLLTVKGVNAYNADYYGFNQRNGHWIIADREGNELPNSEAPVKLAEKNVVNTKYTAVRPGTCYLRYVINEPFPYTLPKKPDKLDSNAALEITVTGEAATTIVTPPTASAIDYGQSLRDSALTGYKVVDDITGDVVEGAFSWKKPSVKPDVADSDTTGYDVVFTPYNTDEMRYAPAECEVTLIVNPVLAKVQTQPYARSLSYNGEAQALVTAGKGDGGTVWYTLGDDNAHAPAFTTDGGWSTDVPTGTEVGDYFVWYWLEPDDNHFVDAEATPICVAARIASQPLDPEAPQGNALTYNGSAQALVKGGYVEGGTLQYIVGDAPPDGEHESLWSRETPTATDAGSYRVWYRVKGDKNHNDTPPYLLETVIRPRPLYVTARSAAKTQGEADPALAYTAEGLVGADRVTGSLARDPGESVGRYAITRGSLAATGNYAMVFTGATLTINPQPPLGAKPDFTLLTKASAYGKRGIKLSWTKVDGAQGYDVFFKKCDGDERYPLYKVVKGTSCKIKKLKKGVCYKGYVWAWRYDGDRRVYIGQPSPVAHCIVGKYNRTQANAKSIKLDRAEFTLGRGQTSAISATVKKVKAKRKLITHEGRVRYLSSNANVASVNADGVVTGVSEGACTIYAITSNGLCASVQVTVQ